MINYLTLMVGIIINILPVKPADNTVKSIYEVGEPLNSCEANLKNLFNNWNSKYLVNADDFVLINYSYVEEIIDTSAIRLYSKLLVDNKSLIGTIKNRSSFETVGNKSVHTYEQTFILRTFESIFETSNSTSMDKLAMINAFENERENLKNSFKSIVNVGDKVFVIFFKDNQNIYKTFIVCNSQTNRVIWDNVFLNIKIKSN